MSILLATPNLDRSDSTGDPVASDWELVVRAKIDDRAFEALYRRYVDHIHRYCFRRLGTREAAEDATSQVFTQALVALPRLVDRGGTFRGWLFTIAHNVVIDQVRAARPEKTIDDAIVVIDPSPSPEDEAIRADAGLRLRAAIAQLPDRQRQVLELRLAGLTGPEIGQVLGCQARTVDVAQFRGVVKLRELMRFESHPAEGHDV